jgi:DNA-binding MarR family transcriptional regulator
VRPPRGRAESASATPGTIVPIEPDVCAPADDVAAGLGELLGTLIRSHPRDISLTSEGVMAVLERGGSSRVADLVTAAGVAQPTMTELVSRLERAGLVTRGRDPGDGRAVLVAITEAGREFMRARREVSHARLAALVAALDHHDRATLVAALPAMARLRALESGPAPRADPTPRPGT